MDHISLEGVVKAISSVETISNTKVCDWQVKWQANCPLLKLCTFLPWK